LTISTTQREEAMSQQVKMNECPNHNWSRILNRLSDFQEVVQNGMTVQIILTISTTQREAMSQQVKMNECPNHNWSRILNRLSDFQEVVQNGMTVQIILTS
jgi:hypothetical protein